MRTQSPESSIIDIGKAMNLLDSKFEFQTLNQALKADFSPAGFLLGGDRKDQRDFLLRFASLEIMDQTF